MISLVCMKMRGMLFAAFCCGSLLGQDLSGTYTARVHEEQPERGPGPDLGDYLGLPLTEAARLRADSWDASLLTLPEWQCRPHPADYGPRHSHVRIWNEYDLATQQLVAIHFHREWQAQERTIWMDGRAHPPEYAKHSWQGFSTGSFTGGTLTITTTHLKTGYIRRNGVPRSSNATLVEHITRHGNFLDWVTIVNDPVYLTEPFIRSSDYEVDTARVIPAYPCEAVTEIDRAKGVVPHHLPGTNKFLDEFRAAHSLPAEAVRGGAETMYPEYRKKISEVKPPAGTAVAAK
jgi:hypothetical protein